MDDPSLNSAKPISPISQLLKNLGMTRDDLTRHSDQMRQFLTAQNANSLRAFSNAESDADADADSVKSPTMLPRALRAKSRSISAADAPAPPSFPPATPIKTEPVELTASSSVRRFESMDEIIERQNRRSKRERRGRREREASPSIHSPARSSLRASGHSRSAATRDTRESRRARAMDDSLPANIGFSQVGRTVILANSASPSETSCRSVQDSLPCSATPSRAGRYYRDTVLYQTVTPQHRRTVCSIYGPSATDAHCRTCLGHVCSPRGVPLSLPVPQE
jgi:hypothetical protein